MDPFPPSLTHKDNTISHRATKYIREQTWLELCFIIDVKMIPRDYIVYLIKSLLQGLSLHSM